MNHYGWAVSSGRDFGAKFTDLQPRFWAAAAVPTPAGPRAYDTIWGILNELSVYVLSGFRRVMRVLEASAAA